MDRGTNSGRPDVSLARGAVQFAFGLLMVVYSTTLFLQVSYMDASPDIGATSTPLSGLAYNAGIFVVGSILVFTAVMHSLHKILQAVYS